MYGVIVGQYANSTQLTTCTNCPHGTSTNSLTGSAHCIIVSLVTIHCQRVRLHVLHVQLVLILRIIMVILHVLHVSLDM